MPAPTLPGRLADLARAHPERVALREKLLGVWVERTWADYWTRVQRVAAGLRVAGIQPGDHVAILSNNRTEWIFADLGAQLIGARSVGIYQTNTAADVAYVLSHSESRIVFCEDQEQVDKVVDCRPDTPTVERVVVFDPRGTRDIADDRMTLWEDFLAQAAVTEPQAAAWLAAMDPDAPSMVVYTSGTTGPPKGALLSSRNVLHAADALVDQLDLGPADSVLSYLPLCHVAEKIFSLFLPLSCGAVVHFGEAIETVQADLREVSPTIFLGVPRIWEKMHAGVTLRMRDSSWLPRVLFEFFSARGQRIADPERTTPLTLSERIVWRLGDLLILRPLQERLGLRDCRMPFTGAAPVSPELLRWFHGVGVPVVEAYGQTECAGVSHTNTPARLQVGSVGRPVDGMECRIAEDGEILVRGEAVFVGYLHNPDATARTVDAEGWLHTGDIGEEDADGFLRITGRKKEIIITAGGKNLSPEKIENTLKLSPYIKEAIAIGDARKFVSALVQIDAEAVGDWATRRELPYTDFADLTRKEDVRKQVQGEISRLNEGLPRVAQVRAFRLLPKELHQDDGELTATQKVRRREVTRIWSPLIEEMYG